MTKLHGTFISKKGTRWTFDIDEDHRAEVWHPTTKKVAGGWKTGKDTYMNPLTKEFKDYIKDNHGIEVR